MLSAIQQQPEPSATRTSDRNETFSEGGDFSTFLKMLTTQMQNQNPLNPVEAADFAVQLATFSGVEQQVHTNQLLARLTERLVSGDLASWLGAEVAASTDVTVNGGNLMLHLPSPAAGTARRDVVFKTATGQEVLRLPVAPGQTTLNMDPSAGGVTPLLAGTYQAEVEDFGPMDLLDTRRAQQFSQVTEVRQGPSGTLLVLSSGAFVDPSAVVSIRKP